MKKLKVKLGTKKIGDIIKTGFEAESRENVITGLGKSWTEYPTDDTACVYELEPGQDYYSPIQYQYAYF